MACTTYPQLVVPSRPVRSAVRLSLVAGAATVFAGAYGWFVASEAARPSHGGALAAYVTGFGFALAAAVGAWAAATRRAWGLSLAALAAQGNLILLALATLLALVEDLVGPGGREPLIALAALGAVQAAVVVLAARPDAALAR